MKRQKKKLLRPRTHQQVVKHLSLFDSGGKSPHPKIIKEGKESMSRVKPVTPEEAKGEVKEIYQSLQKNMGGKVFNIFQNMGNSAATLKGFLALSDAVNQTTLPAKLREQIALVAAQSNHCNYCLSAHTMIAKGSGLSDQDITNARHGESSNGKDQAILKFAKEVIENRGNVSNQDVASLKASGVSDTEFVEIILTIILNMFTNYFNLVTDPKIDFPLAPDLYHSL